MLKKPKFSQLISLDDYNIGKIYNVTKLTGGLVNDLYLVETIDQKYIYKKFNYSTEPFLDDEKRLLFFLESKSFPVPHIVSQKKGVRFLDRKNELLYEYVDGYCSSEPNKLTDNQLKEAGHVLGIYHTLINEFPVKLSTSQRVISHSVDPENFFLQDAATVLWNKVLEIILNKQNMDEQDRQVVEVARTMLESLTKFDSIALNKLVKKLPRVLCHGDYQGTNLIFGTGDKIKVVLDWESSRISPRSWETLYAIATMCKVRNTENFNTPLNLKQVKIFLDAYKEYVNLTNEEIKAMPFMAYVSSLATPFLLQTHYFDNNPNLDRFFPYYKSDWFWWQNNYQRFLDTIK